MELSPSNQTQASSLSASAHVVEPAPVTGYLTSVELRNIRAFRELLVDLGGVSSPRMHSVVVGRNGTCKSTLLRAIALALCHPRDADALLAQPGAQLLSQGEEEGSILVKLASASEEGGATEPTDLPCGEVRITLGRKGNRDVVVERGGSPPAGGVEKETAFLVCGYGAGRGATGATQTRGYRPMDSTATLFDYQRELLDAELLLRRLDDFLGTDGYEHAMSGIRRTLGLAPDDQIELAKGGGVRVSGPGIGSGIPLEAWADGYRTTFQWMLDLYGWAMHADAFSKDGDVRGILLLDEIEQHLHPSMQREVLAGLTEALPQMQIFATTHSPLVALSTTSEHLVALQRRGDHVTAAVVPSLSGYTADDALVEKALFGTDAYPTQSRDELDRYRALVSTPPGQRSPDQVEELERLVAGLDPTKLPALREDPVIDKLDQIADLLRQEAAA